MLKIIGTNVDGFHLKMLINIPINKINPNIPQSTLDVFFILNGNEIVINNSHVIRSNDSNNCSICFINSFEGKLECNKARTAEFLSLKANVITTREIINIITFLIVFITCKLFKTKSFRVFDFIL